MHMNSENYETNDYTYCFWMSKLCCTNCMFHILREVGSKSIHIRHDYLMLSIPSPTLTEKLGGHIKWPLSPVPDITTYLPNIVPYHITRRTLLAKAISFPRCHVTCFTSTTPPPNDTCAFTLGGNNAYSWGPKTYKCTMAIHDKDRPFVENLKVRMGNRICQKWKWRHVPIVQLHVTTQDVRLENTNNPIPVAKTDKPRVHTMDVWDKPTTHC